MNLSSLYKKRFKKDELISYTKEVVCITAMRIEGKLSKKETNDKMVKIINSFLKKYGE